MSEYVEVYFTPIPTAIERFSLDTRSMKPPLSHYPCDDLSLNIEPGCYTLELLGMIIHTLKILIDDELEARFLSLIPFSQLVLRVRLIESLLA